MENRTEQLALFTYRTNSVSLHTSRHRGHYGRLAVTMLLIGSFGYMTFY